MLHVKSLGKQAWWFLTRVFGTGFFYLPALVLHQMKRQNQTVALALICTNISFILTPSQVSVAKDGFSCVAGFPCTASQR